MKFLEKNLEQIIFETSNEKLFEKGLVVDGKKKRQLRIGNYGTADIVTYFNDYGELYLTIYELKLCVINIYALMQVLRYKVGIENYLARRTKLKLNIGICLIGEKLDLGSDFIYLCQQLEILEIYTYSYDVDGIVFKRINLAGYGLINEGFIYN